MWLLEEALRRHPEDVRLRLALANVALLVSDAALVRHVLRADRRRLGSLRDRDDPARPSRAGPRRARHGTRNARGRRGALPRPTRCAYGADHHAAAGAPARGGLAGDRSGAPRRRRGRAAPSAAPSSSCSTGGRLPSRSRKWPAPGCSAWWRGRPRPTRSCGRPSPTGWSDWDVGDEAIERLQSLRSDDSGSASSSPQRSFVWPILARVQDSLGRHEEAEASLRMLVEEAPSSASRVRLAQYLIARSDGEGALRALEEASAAEPKSAMLLHDRAELLVTLGRNAEAEALLSGIRGLRAGLAAGRVSARSTRAGPGRSCRCHPAPRGACSRARYLDHPVLAGTGPRSFG